MRPPKAHLALFATAAVLGAVAPAATAEVVPPQNSAANQYTETYPTAGGDRESRRAEDIGAGGGRGPNGSGTPQLAPGGERELQARGEDGRSVVGLVEATAPAAATAGTNGAAAGAGGSESRTASDPGDEGASATAEVLSRITGASSSGELGPLLPLLLIATLIWAAVFPLLRRRMG